MRQSKKARKRLAGRVAGYDAIKGQDVTPKKKTVNKSEFTKPGSLKK